MAETTSPWHLSRGWGADPYAPECGCEVAPCGHVIDGKVNPDCAQHPIDRMKSFRSVHRERFCPGEAGSHRDGAS